jgi:hypothetical protein
LPIIYSFRDFTVHVYFSEPLHRLPHCHVRRSGEPLATVALATLEVLVGQRPLPRYIRTSLIDHLDELWDAWNEFND